MPTTRRLAVLFLPPFIVFVVHGLLVYGFDVYAFIPWLDLPMHFIGGVVIAFTLSGCLAVAEDASLIRVNSSWIRFGLIVCFVNAAATVWEFAEFFCDHFWGTRTQESLEDTMIDIFLGLLGGTVFATIEFLRNRRE